MYDLILQGGNPFCQHAGQDIAIQNGRIAALGPSLQGDAVQVVAIENKLVIPSFVDSHMHLDKVLMGSEQDAGNTLDAVHIMLAHAKGLAKEKIIDDILRRARVVVNWELAHGSRTLKTHLYCNQIWGMESVYAHEALKQEYEGRINILNIVPWYDDFDEALGAEFDSLCAEGRVDFIGGYPYGTADYRERIDTIFEKALRFSLPIDLHVDEKDIPDCEAFTYICQKTIETGMQGRVTCGHVTTLNSVDDDTAARVIALAAQAEMHVITLPSCNMYLLGRNDHQPIRRGVTRIDEFLQAGVNIAYASDNVRDPFRPFGNGSMLEEGLFAAQVMQYGTRDKLSAVLRMGTENAAKNCLLKDYGLSVGCRADICVLDAPSPAEALKSQSSCLYVLKDGRMVAGEKSL